MRKKTFDEASRARWSTRGEVATMEEVRTGAFQRIATALERLATSAERNSREVERRNQRALARLQREVRDLRALVAEHHERRHEP